MTIDARIAKGIIAAMMRWYPYLMKEAVIPPGYHKHKDPEKKALKGKYPKKGE